MRQDMGKVTVERPRTMSSARSKGCAESIPWYGHEADYDDQPKRGKVSAGWLYGYDQKGQTDVLSPLYRYLRKQVGRPWNKVYSEICRVMDRRNVCQDHVFNHIYDLVMKNPVLHKDGVWRTTEAPWSLESELFVHPKTGLLTVNKNRKSFRERFMSPAPGPIEEIKIDPTHLYKKMDGHWFLVEIREIPRDEWRIAYPKPIKKYDIVAKRQLGKKELRKLRAEHKEIA